MANKSMDQGCLIHGYYLNPETCLKVINHPLRREILHKLYTLTVKGPITKRNLADSLGIDYYELIYQLNNHLKDFWQVRYEKKRRGAREEFIAPPEVNAVYIMLGSGATIYMLDPLANLYGKIGEIGVRCQKCAPIQVDRCLEEISSQRCLDFCPEERQKLAKILEINSRRMPFTPIDYIVACTALRSLEGQGCIINLSRTACEFLKRIEGQAGFYAGFLRP